MSLVLFGITSMTSCSSDDDDNDNKSDEPLSTSIIGAWTTGVQEANVESKARKNKKSPKKVYTYKYDQYINYYLSDGRIMTFWVDFDENMNVLNVSMEQSSYVLDGNKLTEYTYYGPNEFEVTVKNNKMKMLIYDESEDRTYTQIYEKMEQEEVDKYLNIAVNYLFDGAWQSRERYNDEREMFHFNVFVFNEDNTIRGLDVYTDSELSFAETLNGKWTFNNLRLALELGGEKQPDYFFEIMFNGETRSLYFYLDPKDNEYAPWTFDQVPLDDVQDYFDNADK